MTPEHLEEFATVRRTLLGVEDHLMSIYAASMAMGLRELASRLNDNIQAIGEARRRMDATLDAALDDDLKRATESSANLLKTALAATDLKEPDNGT